HATLAQEREVLVGHTPGEDGDDMIAVDVVRLPREAATRVDGEGEGVVRARRDEVVAMPTRVLACDLGVGTQAAGERLHRDAAADPAVGLVPRVDLLVLSTHRSRGRSGPAIDDDAAVDGDGHVAA